MDRTTRTHIFSLLLRDITLSVAIGLLLPFIAYLLAQVIQKPVPFNDIPCEYKGTSCKVLEESKHQAEKRLKELKITQKVLSTTSQSVTQNVQVDKEINELEAQLKQVKENIEEAQKQRNSTYESANEKPTKIHLYVAIAIALLAFLAAFFIPVLSLEIGFIIGGTLTLITGLIHSWSLLGDVLKLVGLLLGLIALIGIGLKMYFRKEDSL